MTDRGEELARAEESGEEPSSDPNVRFAEKMLKDAGNSKRKLMLGTAEQKLRRHAQVKSWPAR